MKKVLKVLGWILIPYILIIVFWKKLNKTGKIAGIIYSVIIIISAIVNGNTEGNVGQSTSQTAATSTSPNASTNTDNATSVQAKQAHSATESKTNQQAELQALGDWGIQSNSNDFANRYKQIQNDIAAGDRQSAYNEATMASKRADDLNSKTMNNQDMNNVPSDIPSNVRDILSGVDYLLATGYMSEKDGFDKLADAINTNDLSKLDDVKQDFAVATDQFNQAKALIIKANNALK